MDKQVGFSDLFDSSGLGDQLFVPLSYIVSYRFTFNKTQLTEFPE